VAFGCIAVIQWLRKLAAKMHNPGDDDVIAAQLAADFVSER